MREKLGVVKHALDRDGSQEACVLKASQLPVGDLV